MGKRTRSRKPDANVVGKGKVTAPQIAFIVDCYLANNNFSKAQSLFRSEASSLLPKRLFQQAPEKLLRLEEIMEEYICLKEQKVMLDQTMHELNLAKARLQTICTTPSMPSSSNCSNVPSMVPNPMEISPAGFTALNTPHRRSKCVPDQSNTRDHDKLSTPALNPRPPRKRKGCESASNVSEPTKKPCGLTPDNQSAFRGQPQDYAASTKDTDKGNSASASVTPDRSPVQGSTVAKNLVTSSCESPISNSSVLHTPQRSTTSCHSDSSMVCSSAKSNLTTTSVETTPTKCTFITSKTVIFNSPMKHYSIDRRHCAFSPSPSKRDQVKGRLDFDDTTDLPMMPNNSSSDLFCLSGSDKDGELYDLDFEPLAPDFSISELLHEFGIGCDVVEYIF